MKLLSTRALNQGLWEKWGKTTCLPLLCCVLGSFPVLMLWFMLSNISIIMSFPYIVGSKLESLHFWFLFLHFIETLARFRSAWRQGRHWIVPRPISNVKLHSWYARRLNNTSPSPSVDCSARPQLSAATSRWNHDLEPSARLDWVALTPLPFSSLSDRIFNCCNLQWSLYEQFLQLRWLFHELKKTVAPNVVCPYNLLAILVLQLHGYSRLPRYFPANKHIPHICTPDLWILFWREPRSGLHGKGLHHVLCLLDFICAHIAHINIITAPINYLTYVGEKISNSL